MDVKMRPAQPSDVDDAVPLIYCSDEHAYDYAFATGRHPATDFIRDLFLGQTTTESYRGFEVALVDGRLVGVGSFLAGGEFGNLNTVRLLWRILRFYGLRECWSVFARGLRIQPLMAPPEKDALFIQKVGVSPELRGKGVGTALLNEQIRRARDRGFRRCVLDVAATNPGAQRLYERMGFRVVGEKRLEARDAADVPAQRRMELVL